MLNSVEPVLKKKKKKRKPASWCTIEFSRVLLPCQLAFCSLHCEHVIYAFWVGLLYPGVAKANKASQPWHLTGIAGLHGRYTYGWDNKRSGRSELQSCIFGSVPCQLSFLPKKRTLTLGYFEVLFTSKRSLLELGVHLNLCSNFHHFCSFLFSLEFCSFQFNTKVTLCSADCFNNVQEYTRCSPSMSQKYM